MRIVLSSCHSRKSTNGVYSSHITNNFLRVSPKTLATVFDNCLRPQGIEEDLKRSAPRIENDISTSSNETISGRKSPTPGGSQKKVLLVEDNAVNLKVRSNISDGQ